MRLYPLIAILICGLLLLPEGYTQMVSPGGRDSTAASSGVQSNADNSSKKTSSAGEVEVSYNGIDSPLLDILWCGNEKENILILTEKGSVYHTLDMGNTWNKLREDFQNVAKGTGLKIERADVTRLLPSPVDPKLIIFVGSSGVNWVTENCGSDIHAFKSGKNIKEFEFHPTRRDWILASAYTTCEDFSDEPCKIFKELYVSKTLGQEWIPVANYVIQFAWGVQESKFLSVMPAERIIIAHHLEKKGHQKTSGWTEDAEIAYSDDFFKTKTTILQNGNKFLVTADYFFAVQVDDEDSQDVRLHAGDPKRKQYKLNPVQLPKKKKKSTNSKSGASKLREHSYTILDTTEGQVFLHINHEGERSKYGNIYISDSTGLRYSMSLRSSVRNLDGQCDFEKVAGLEGIYLANVYDKDMVEKINSNPTQGMDIPTSQQSSKPTKKVNPFKTSSVKIDQRSQNLDDFKRTMITFDKGAIWEPLSPPKKNVDDELIQCEGEEDCALHLHSLSNTKFGPFYSTETSLGIVLGTGNVGTYLSNKKDEVNTYLSRDGGLTWFEIMRGSHIYEIGDHGAILVAAPDQEATEFIWYSWNEGLTWEKLRISNSPIQISNIIIEPSNTGEHFVIYGRTTSGAKESVKEPKGAVITLDFTTLHERECQLPYKPNTEESDYETYTPNGHISASCLMGHSTTYVRRKREAQCYNKEEFDAWTSSKNCVCTEEDWECDVGFERSKEGPCKNMMDEPVTFDPPEDCDGDYYYVTQGYRKVAGNTCEGGVSHAATRLPCPSKTFTKSNAIMLLALGSLAAGIYFLYKNNYASKATDFAKSLKDKALKSGGSNFSKLGFKKMGQEEPGSLNDDDDDFDNRLRFDDHDDEPAQALGDKNLMDVVRGGKKMAGRSALNSAQKDIPMISKPSEGTELLE